MTKLDDSLQALGISMDYSGLLSRFVALFARWNERINLSAASSTAEIEDHVVDSIHVVPLLIATNACRVIDVGAGGGFPVIPAAICLPNVSFTALEPVHKKHAFLRTAARELRLANLESFAERAQDHEHDDYEVAMSRATFDLVEWLELGSSLVVVGGTVLGFEAVPRADLPATSERTEYSINGKRRAIVQFRRSC